jgi:hypothetical protein
MRQALTQAPVKCSQGSDWRWGQAPACAGVTRSFGSGETAIGARRRHWTGSYNGHK